MRKASLYIFLLLFLSSCTGLKYIPKTEKLYTGANIKVVSADKKWVKGVKGSMSDVKPKPNSTFLGMRPGLWFYYVTGKPKKPKGGRAWIKKHFGEEPVYISAVDTLLSARAIDAKLYNTGYLDSYDTFAVKDGHHGKTASIDYTIFLKQPYTIKSVSFPVDSDDIGKAIAKSEKKSLLKKGDRYKLETLVAERKRIDQSLKHKGFYYFTPDYILFAMDTGMGDRTLTLRATIKTTAPERSKEIYHIRSIDVYPDYSLGKNITDSMHTLPDTTIAKVDSVNYYNITNYIRPKAVMNGVYFRPGHIYDSRVYTHTLSRLNGFSVFKYINIDIANMDSIERHALAMKILMMPLPKKAVRVEVDGYTKSDNFTGPSLTLSLRNRNAFKGAELVVFSLAGSFESQFSGQYKGQFTYEIDPGIQFNIPRFISPFHLRSSSDYVPHTQIELDYSYLSRVGYFDLNSFKATFGYNWKTNPLITHTLKPINLNYYNIYNKKPIFDTLIADNPLLERRFESQFIAGITYSFLYNEQVKTTKKNQFYFNANIDLSGNTMSLLYLMIYKHTPNPNSTLLGVNVAQYARIDIDVRDHVHIAKSVLAFRFIAGWGRAYGSSVALPYEKQFFSGGAYSLRGFPAYSVGPGAYLPPYSNIFYLQQGGEIKLEWNAEYRFPIISYLKGALFVDAGNTWLNKPNPDAPGGQFLWNTFYKQIASSAGAGLRVDLNFFVVRFDIGLPIERPGLSDIWMIKTTNFNSLEFNFAFGYPF